MIVGITISQTGPETVWNAFRFGVFAIDRGHIVKVFLIGEGVECDEIKDDSFNVQEQIAKFNSKGGKIYACGTCLKSRNKEGSAICPLSTMQDLLNIVEESDKLLTF